MPTEIPGFMTAVLLQGHGGPEMLEYRTDVPVARPGPGEVLIRVAAAGVNNTDINTRVGWYSKNVTGATSTGGKDGFAEASHVDGSWSGTALKFPRIQGADCCGHVVSVGNGITTDRIGERVVVRSCLLGSSGSAPYKASWLGSECDGAFAQYTVVPASDALVMDCDWSDTQLASLPCAWSTAEGLLQRSGVTDGDRVLITGASGGVGSAAVQLARCRGAEVIAVASAAKAGWVGELGAIQIIESGKDPARCLGPESISAVIDLVGGPHWPRLLDVLERGGRYATSGAIAGPIVELDLRTLYLKDLILHGCTWQDAKVLESVVSYIESGQVRPLVSRTYPLKDIHLAQEDFISKKYPGKLVLVPPPGKDS